MTATSGITLTNGDAEIYALQLDVDLPPNPSDNFSSNDMIMQIDVDEERIETVMTMVNFPGEPGTNLLVRMEGYLTNGDVISQTFSVDAGVWTPLFWPTRGNDFDATGTTKQIDHVSIYLASPGGYEGSVYFDYLGLYRRLPRQE